MGIVGLLISRGVRFMADGLNGPTNEEARKLLEIRLEEAQARHAEDLERLGREMSEVVAQPLQARLDVARRVERDVRTALCASMSECTDVAARRVAGERDLARAERDMYRQGCENWSKLDAPVSEFRRVLRVCDYESTLGAARRVVAERDELRDRAEKAEASLEAARSNASLVTMVGDIGVRNSGDATRLEAILAERDALAAELAAIRSATGEEPSHESLYRTSFAGHRALYNLGRNAAQGEVAMMREAARGRDATIETLRTQQEEQAEEVATLRDRVAELEAIAREAESQANDMVSQKIAALGMAVNGAADEEAVSPDVQVVRGDFVMTKFRERLARIEAASPPAPQGLPVATDEELREAYITAITGAESPAAVLPHALRAVAARVRAERPACLVARAVALGCDVRVIAGDMRCGVHVKGGKIDIMASTRTADVPATLARLLDEVEAARKAVQR